MSGALLLCYSAQKNKKKDMGSARRKKVCGPSICESSTLSTQTLRYGAKRKKRIALILELV